MPISGHTRKQASRALQRKWDDFPPSVQEELTDLENRLGGRRGLCGLLALAPLNKDLRYVLGLLGDPRNDRTSLAAVCAQGNILPGELLKLLGQAALHKGQVLAKQKIGDHLPLVVDDLMRKAAPYRDSCADCLGTGSLTPDPTPEQPNPSPLPCPTCTGTGMLQYEPTFERQKLAIEMGGLLPKGGGIAIQTNVNLPPGGAGSAGGGALEQLQSLTDELLYGEGEVFEGEAVASADPGDPAAEPTP